MSQASAREPEPPQERPTRRFTRPVIWASLAALAVTFAATAALLRLEGRVWFCKCWEPRLWIGDPQGAHTSQHLLDPYSLSHVQHGLLLYLALIFVWPNRATARGLPSRSRRVLRFWAATLVECAWEVLENSPAVIDRYRTATAALGYEGDSVWNSLGDVLACAAGYVLAEAVGWRRTLVLFAAIELGMVLWIRDSLLLNVLMLAFPLEAVKAWQAGG